MDGTPTPALIRVFGNVSIVCFVWKVRQATLIRVGGKTNAAIKVKAGATLDILVENMGRINYGLHLQDPKGILGDVILDNVVLRNWKIYPLHLDQVVGVKKSPPAAVKNDEASIQIPTFYTGNIPPAPDGIPKDTFLNLPGWFKVKRLKVENFVFGFLTANRTFLTKQVLGICCTFSNTR